MATEKVSLDELKQIKWQTIYESLPFELRNSGEDMSLFAKKLEEICRLVTDYFNKARRYLSEEEVYFLTKEWGFYVEHTIGTYLKEDPPEEGLDWMEGYLCGFVGMVRATLVHVKE